MSEEVLARYGSIEIYMEPNHPSPVYHVHGNTEANPYGALKPLLEDDQLEEVMYNGGQQCVKVAHREHGMCRTNIWIEDDEGLKIASNIAAFTNVPLGDGPGKVGVLRKEPVAGVHRIGTGALDDREDGLGVQIALGSRLAPQGVGLVGQAHVQRVAVNIGVDGDGRHALLTAGPDDPDSDFAPIGDQNL